MVYGAGRVGTAVIYDLIKHCNAKAVTVYEPNLDVATASKRRLRKLLGKKYSATFLPTTGNTYTIASEHDVIISCAPYVANEGITDIALATKTPMVDLGGNPDIVAKQEEMSKGHDTLIVPECGISPGISNILAMGLAQKGHTYILVRCGGVPDKKPDNGFAHKIMFSVEGMVSEYLGQVPCIENGEMKFSKALEVSRKEGYFECSCTSNNSPQVVQSFINAGVTHYNYFTMRHPGHWNKIKQVISDLGEDHESIVKYLQAQPGISYNPKIDTDKLVLLVTGGKNLEENPVKNCLAEDETVTLQICADKENTGFSAMELTTAWGATIVAYSIAVRKYAYILPKGFNTPERFINAEATLLALRRRIKLLKDCKY